jgi:hypothetical protein
MPPEKRLQVAEDEDDAASISSIEENRHGPHRGNSKNTEGALLLRQRRCSRSARASISQASDHIQLRASSRSMTLTCRPFIGFEELMRRIQYLTLFSASALTRTAKKLSWSMLTDGIGNIHGPVSLRHAAIKTVNYINNDVRRPTFDCNQFGSTYLELR